MKLVDLSITDFYNAVDSDQAVPGGGSVAALAGCLGASLIGMVGKLTLPKKKFSALSMEIQNEFRQKLETIGKIKLELSNLVDKDTEAYQMVMDAYKHPKATEDDIVLRNQLILEGTKAAIKVPFQVAMLALEAMGCMEFILSYGNQSAASDLGVACLMLLTAMEGAILNVKTNLSGLNNDVTRLFYSNNVKAMLAQGESFKKTLMATINGKIES